MKTRNFFLIATMVLFCLQVGAQNQVFAIHQDHVKPSMAASYEKAAKELVDAHKKFDIKNTNWSAIRMSNGTYMYVEPIANMAALDIDNNKMLVEKMGKPNVIAIYERMDKCYDSHGSFLVTLQKDLTYDAPSANVNEVYNFLKFHFFYVTPANSKAMYDQIKVIKSLYVMQNANESFQIYRSGFGIIDEYYVAVVSAKDEQSYLKMSDETETKLGKEGQDAMMALFSLAKRYDPQTGYMVESLSYNAAK